MHFRATAPIPTLLIIILLIAGIALAAPKVIYAPGAGPKHEDGGTTPDKLQVQVVDGDTIRAHGQVYRLVGFDTPETGLRAKCESERTWEHAQHPGFDSWWQRADFG